jgi:hypothetical protein
MRLMDLPHMAALPFLTCNFECPYCIATPKMYKENNPFGLWESRYDDVFRFISNLEKKMIMVSGGEPLLWRRWRELISETDHYWYFSTNASKIPGWLGDNTIKERVKLFIATFHRTGIAVGRFIDNVKRLQDFGYSVFVKMVFVRDMEQINEAEKTIQAGIPMSFVPLVGGEYSPDEVDMLMPYCQSDMYYRRFLVDGRKPSLCLAGTNESFGVDGLVLTRCSHYSSISLNKVPLLFRGFAKGYIGDIYKPRYYEKPKMCSKPVCACEWHSFGGLYDDIENGRWQHFIDTGKWVTAK